MSWFRWRFTFIKTNHRVLPIEIFAQFLILRGQFFWCVKKRFFFVKKTQWTAKMIYWPSKPIDFLSFRSQNKMYRFLRLFRNGKAFLSFFNAQNYLKDSKFSYFFWPYTDRLFWFWILILHRKIFFWINHQILIKKHVSHATIDQFLKMAYFQEK